MTRRYYLPTCSLEVQAPKAPLWKQLLPASRQRPLQFQLVLDDPCSPKQEPVTIAGDRERFNALYIAVTDLLRQSEAASEATSPKTAPEAVVRSLTLTLDGLETNAAPTEIALNERQLADLAAALGQCAAEVNLGWESGGIELIVPRRSPRVRLWAAAGAAGAIALGGAWLARGYLPWQLEARGDRNSPTLVEEVSSPSPELLPLPPERPIDLKLQEPTAPTFKAAPMDPPNPVGRPST